MPKRQMLSICRKEGYSVAELTDIQNELKQLVPDTINTTSTDVVILDQDGKIKSTMIILTGGGAMMSAEKSLEQAVEKSRNPKK